MRAQISSMQNTSQNTMNSTSQFAQAHVEQDKQCDEFPFHLVSMTHEAIPDLLNGGDGLLRMDVDIYLWKGALAVARTLIDGGSKHSFINPTALSGDQRNTFTLNKEKYDRKLFIITSATGVVREFCYILKCRLTFGGWSGDVQLVVSSMLNKNQMVLGQRFLETLQH